MTTDKYLKVSICLPTHNRQAGLIRVLRSFEQQDDSDFEIVIGDNSKDASARQPIEEFMGQSGLNIKYFHYPLGGVQHILSKVVSETKGDILLFVADDEAVCPKFVSGYRELFTKYPECVIGSGPLLIRWEEQPPKWIEDFIKDKPELKHFWGNFEYGDEIKVGNHIPMWGGNSAFRKEIFETTGFRPSLYKGWMYGNDESGLWKELETKGSIFGYTPIAYAYHFQPKSRMTIKYVCWVACYFGVSKTYHRWHAKHINLFVEQFRILGIYWKTWLKYYYKRLAHKPLDTDTVLTYYLAYCGFSQIKYIWQVFTNHNYARQQLRQTDFRPEECLKMAEKYFS